MKKFLAILLILLVVILTAAIIMQAAFSNKVKAQLIKGLKNIIATDAEIDNMEINLIRGIASFSGLKVSNPPGYNEKYFLTIKNGVIHVHILNLLFGKVVIEYVSIDSPEVNLEISKDSICNASRIFRKKGAVPNAQVVAAPKQDTAFYFIINEAAVNNGVFKLVNYKANPEGATALFDKINVIIKNLRPAQRANELPTMVTCSARLPAEKYTGDIQFSASGNFITKHVDFDLALKATGISIPYFMTFYITTASVFATNGWADLVSSAKCRDNQLDAVQRVNVRDLALEANPSKLEDNLLFGLPVLNVANFFANSKGNLDFDFNITGTINDPKFHLMEALKKVLAKSIGEAILNNLSQIPQMILQNISGGGKAETSGKELIKNVFKQILAPAQQRDQK